MLFLKHPKKKRGAHRPPCHRPPYRLDVETLEGRCVPAAFLQAGKLEINGTAGNDYAVVTEFGFGTNTTIRVLLNGTQSDFLKATLPKGIIFRGYGGDDTFQSSANVVVWASGGAGNDQLSGGPMADQLKGDSDNDTLWGGAGKDVLDGGSEDDYLLGGSHNDILYGRGGNDLLHGGGENDTLYGEKDNDKLFGDWGNDQLSGGDNDDELYGNEGKDTLFGNADNDQLFGGDNDDKLYGNKGNDDLYGHHGGDTLDGGAGLDGLCGGVGTDDIRGGADADRFLLIQEVLDVQFDEVKDYDDDLEAKVFFWAGFTPGVGDLNGEKWTYAEIEAVDTALALLHHHPLTQGTQLLKRSDGGSLTFSRYNFGGDEIGAGDAGYEPGEASSISVYDYGFTVGIVSTIVEAIARGWAWQSVNDQWDSFKVVSGWTQEPDVGPVYTKAQDGWWYLADTGFVSAAASSSPLQDWSATFTYYILSGNTHPDADVQVKLNVVGTFLFDLA